ncbi:MAG: cytochrome P450 [Pseudomonadota bacterium]
MTGRLLPPRIDAASLANLEDPYPAYAELRKHGRVIRGGPGQFVIPRYDDVSDLLRSGRLSNEFPESYRHQLHGDGPAADFLARIMLHRDPPFHREIRRMLGIPFEKSRLPQLARRAVELTGSLLRTSPDGRFDLVQDLAIPLPVRMICEIIGLPEEMSEAVRPRIVALSRAFRLQLSDDDRRLADEAVLFLRDAVAAVLESPRRPVWLSHAAGNTISRDDVIDNLVFLLFAGFETTSSLIATGGAILCEREDLVDRLSRDERLLAPFIEEVLRFDAPIQSRARYTRESVRIGEHEIRPGRIVVLLIGSANRDPDVFEDPDSVLLTRRTNPHLSFGVGVHFCLGAFLARAEAHAAFRALLGRKWRPAPDTLPVRDLSSVFRGYRSIATIFD